ncbi:MAG: SBBP repeat-containing protein [Bacteroidetes bacterium]|nr:SBBP repeat-containing protein [Bacteroidota bacterium]
MKKNYLALLICLLPCLVHAQIFDLEWAKSIGGTTTDNGYSVTTDGFGNVYVTGVYTGIVDFDPGTDTFTLTSNGMEDVFIQKLDRRGNLIWAISTGGSFSDNAFVILIELSLSSLYS